MYSYIEVKKFENNETIKRFDVSNKSERAMQKIENGMNINLDHENYYTEAITSEWELPKV